MDEAHLQHWLSTASKGRSQAERRDLEMRGRSAASRAVAEYGQLWNAWAIGEKPRRKTMRLYGDLFAIKHALEAEETAKPVELVWGIGITTWILEFLKGSVLDNGHSADFRWQCMAWLLGTQGSGSDGRTVGNAPVLIIKNRPRAQRAAAVARREHGRRRFCAGRAANTPPPGRRSAFETAVFNP
jgi:hypothetical protein